MKSLKLLLIIGFVTISQWVYAQTGTIRGKVIDGETGEGLWGVTVQIEGTSIGASADFDGNYVISNVTPGTYNIKASFISYQTKTITGVEVKTNEVTVL